MRSRISASPLLEETDLTRLTISDSSWLGPSLESCRRVVEEKTRALLSTERRESVRESSEKILDRRSIAVLPPLVRVLERVLVLENGMCESVCGACGFHSRRAAGSIGEIDLLGPLEGDSLAKAWLSRDTTWSTPLASETSDLALRGRAASSNRRRAFGSPRLRRSFTTRAPISLLLAPCSRRSRHCATSSAARARCSTSDQPASTRTFLTSGVNDESNASDSRKLSVSTMSLTACTKAVMVSWARRASKSLNFRCSISRNCAGSAITFWKQIRLASALRNLAASSFRKCPDSSNAATSLRYAASIFFTSSHCACSRISRWSTICLRIFVMMVSTFITSTAPRAIRTTRRFFFIKSAIARKVVFGTLSTARRACWYVARMAARSRELAARLAVPTACFTCKLNLGSPWRWGSPASWALRRECIICMVPAHENC
mmetsp:Transcript_141064/g.316304  ORF Transcript_141064/g.316304 Transcript_141064/m.316304 type:complete len:433 (+) Transcript_141064:1738-3036(+)